MAQHTLQIEEVLQVADGIISVCISCCGQRGEWKPCPGCGAKPADEQGCDQCKRTFLEPHPLGGQYPATKPGQVKDADTRSWNTFHLAVVGPNGITMRSQADLEAFIAEQQQRIAAQHEGSLQAVQHALTLRAAGSVSVVV